ncbi:hypothetical protein [Halodesulfovibrio aestuarii]|uniref:Helix-turn-helix domain-containing protein n=1 Tax=Halodesulfovibrio aestuarii TaxID=126333 RepID=A0A8G2FBQ6_9BACT|nr:hypothetical protein [Halodesulfovibrio aestuarii]SHJ48106.1 hypothetical protein SAMN05660830_02543 [Halodesulfovibrio aestuarii]
MNVYGYNDACDNCGIEPGAEYSLPPSAVLQGRARTYISNGQIVLVGLTAICRAVGAGPSTIKKWIKEENFPVRKCSDGIYRASPEAIREWFSNTLPKNM